MLKSSSRNGTHSHAGIAAVGQSRPLAPHSASYNRSAIGSASASRRRARIRAIASKATSRATARTNRSLAVSFIFRFHLGAMTLRAIGGQPALRAISPSRTGLANNFSATCPTLSVVIQSIIFGRTFSTRSPAPHPPALARRRVGGGGPFVYLTRATIALAFYRFSIVGLSVLRLLSNPRDQAPVNEPDAPCTMPE